MGRERSLCIAVGTWLALAIAATTAPAQTEGTRDSVEVDRWIAPDKAAHVFAGAWSAGAGYAAASWLEGDRSERRAAAVATGLAAGLAKEAFDRYVQKERFSWKDLVADALGIAILVGATTAAEP
jgi:uncharacterized protein YfiM (DUF2279 family)